MPNDIAETSEKGQRSFVRCLCVDPHQSIFLATGKIEAVFVDDHLWEPGGGGFEIDRSGYRIKFWCWIPDIFGVKALVVNPTTWPQMAYQSWP